MAKSMMIPIFGPYRSGTQDNRDKMRENLEKLESAAWPIFEKRHFKITGEWVALPILRSGGGGAPKSARHEAVMYPKAHRLLAKCDGVLRIRRASIGADNDMCIAKKRSIPVCTDIAEISPAKDGCCG